MSPALLFIWIPVIAIAAILLPAALFLGAAVGINGARRGRPAAAPPMLPVLRELPRKAA